MIGGIDDAVVRSADSMKFDVWGIEHPAFERILFAGLEQPNPDDNWEINGLRLKFTKEMVRKRTVTITAWEAGS